MGTAFPSEFWLNMKRCLSGRPIFSLCLMSVWVIHLRTLRRGRICIAQSGSGLLVGEVSILDCFKVAICDSTGSWQPCSDTEKDKAQFLFNPKNLQKHQLTVTDTHILDKWSDVYAWELDQPVPYVSSIPFHHKKGAIVWAKLEGTVQHTTVTRLGLIFFFDILHL